MADWAGANVGLYGERAEVRSRLTVAAGSPSEPQHICGNATVRGVGAWAWCGERTQVYNGLPLW